MNHLGPEETLLTKTENPRAVRKRDIFDKMKTLGKLYDKSQRQMIDLGKILEMPGRENGLSLIQGSKDSDQLTEHSSRRINSKRPINKRNDIQITLVREVELKYQ